MKLLDLGEFDTPILLFGGPYSNLEATEALLAHAEALGIKPDACICTGDLVAYCGDPARTVQTLRQAGVHVVAGNCENQLAAGARDCGCGFEAGSTCDLLSVGWFAHANAAIGSGDRTWMTGLPDMITFSQAGQRCAVIHGGISDVSRFIWSVSDVSVFAEEVALVRALAGPVDIVIAGHSGIAFERGVAGVRWINAGVIGMPPNDGGNRTEFVVLEKGLAKFRTLTYDHARARIMMEEAGLTQGYHAALESGHWPSEDVLPPELRRDVLASG